MRAPELSPEDISRRLREGLGDAVEDLVISRGQVTAIVAPSSWADAATFVKEDETLACTYFSWLSAIDWSDAGAEDEILESEEEAEEAEVERDAAEQSAREPKSPAPDDPGTTASATHAPGEYRRPSGDVFQVLAWMSSPGRGFGLLLKANLPKEIAKISSLTGVFAGANWHERECAEMFGIEFEGHPNPEKLYLPEEFEGHPLLKTFKLGAREAKPWPGIVDVEEIPEGLEAELDAIARGEGSGE